MLRAYTPYVSQVRRRSQRRAGRRPALSRRTAPGRWTGLRPRTAPGNHPAACGRHPSTEGIRTWVGRGLDVGCVDANPPQLSSKPLSPLWRGAARRRRGGSPPQGATPVLPFNAPLCRGGCRLSGGGCLPQDATPVLTLVSDI
ncbi:MAG: hypothetical protein LBM98_03650 [Oscillospiraceae bacterium]|nr:hypothetical protein [Oscillospiraceae bacterium]